MKVLGWLVGLVAAVGLAVASSLATAGPAEAAYAPFESDDVVCRLDESDVRYTIIISRQVFDDHSCEAFGKNEEQYVYWHTCGTCDESQPVIEEKNLTSAGRSTACVQKDYYEDSRYGYDYLPNTKCLVPVPEDYETGIRLCYFYLESEEEDVFFPRQAFGDDRVFCDDILIFDASALKFYQASDPPFEWETAHEDTWPDPGDDDTDGLINLRLCDNFTHFLELTDYTADACSRMGEAIDSNTGSITTAHESLHTLPKLYGKTMPSPEPGVAPADQVYNILAGDGIEVLNQTGTLYCTAGPQMTWTEGGRKMYGMVIPSHCATDGIGTVVNKVGRGFASWIGVDLTRHIGEVVAVSDTHDLALVEYYWVECSTPPDCVGYEIRGSQAIRARKSVLIWNRFRAVSSAYNWTNDESSVGHEFHEFHGFGNATGSYSGEFLLEAIASDEGGALATTPMPIRGDSGGPIWDPVLTSKGSLDRLVPIAGMLTSSHPDLGASGLVRSDTVLSWVQSQKSSANFVMW